MTDTDASLKLTTDASLKLTTDASLKLTTDVDDFIDSLKSWDILLFDSMHGMSHLIKLTENRPVNHAALYTADGQFLHVILSNPPLKAVHTGSLKETLDLREVLTVTALRHADGETLWPKVQKAAQDMEKESRYALLGLICLFVPTLLRSYAKQALKRPRDGLLLEFGLLLLGGVNVRIRDFRTRVEGRHVWSLTCSEFVYRAYDQAENDSILIQDPLFRWDEHKEAVPREIRGAAELIETLIGWLYRGDGFSSPGDGTGSTVAASSWTSMPTSATARWTTMPTSDTARWTTMPTSATAHWTSMPTPDPARGHTILVSSWTTMPTSATAYPRAEVQRWLEQLRSGAQLIRDLCQSNANRDKYGAYTRRTGAPVAEAVTPGDLWSSPTLKPRVIFHVPPFSAPLQGPVG